MISEEEADRSAEEFFDDGDTGKRVEEDLALHSSSR